MAKHAQTIRRLSPANFLSVFNHFVGLAPKDLSWIKQLHSNQYYFVILLAKYFHFFLRQIEIGIFIQQTHAYPKFEKP